MKKPNAELNYEKGYRIGLVVGAIDEKLRLRKWLDTNSHMFKNVNGKSVAMVEVDELIKFIEPK